MRVRVRTRGTTSAMTATVPYAVDRWNGADWQLWSVYRTEEDAMTAAHELESLEPTEAEILYETPA